MAQRTFVLFLRTALAAAATSALLGNAAFAQSDSSRIAPTHGAHHQATAQAPQLQLSAEAAATVATDELTVTLAYEQSGTVVSSLNSAVLQQLNNGLSQAKRISGIESRLNSIQTNPTWDDKGKRKGWTVRGELVLRSKNIQGLSDLAGQLSETLQLAGVQYSVSQELQAKTREGLIADAAAAFKTKASAASKALGFSSYEVYNVSLSDGGNSPPPMAFKARGAMMAMSADSQSLPTEGGTERLSVTFSGTVDMKR